MSDLHEHDAHRPDAYHSAIATAAHQLWERDGSPPNRDLHYWLEAEKAVLRQRAAAASAPLLLRDAHDPAAPPSGGARRVASPPAPASAAGTVRTAPRPASRVKSQGFPARPRAMSL